MTAEATLVEKAQQDVGSSQPLPPPGRMPHELTQAQYLAHAMVIAVYPIMEGGQIRLGPADDAAEQAYGQFREILQTQAPPGVDDAAQWAAGKLDLLFRRSFEQDIWFSTLPDTRPLVLVKKAAIEARQMSLRDALQRVHLKQVATAVQKGHAVPARVMAEYQQSLTDMTSREVQ